MKRLTFSKPFGGWDNARKLIPESYKIEDKIFEMTDGNEQYRIRWENQRPELLLATSKTQITEDIQRINSLINYDGRKTFAAPNSKVSIDENKVLADMLNISRKLMTEAEDIEGQKPEKEGPWEEAGQTVAPEVPAEHKKKLQSKDGSAPKSKEKNWEKVNEGEDIEGQKPEKTAQFDKTNKPVAPEVPGVHKKKLQDKDGTAPKAAVKDASKAKTVAPEVPAEHKKKLQSKDGTAPAPKEGPWEEADVAQAADATKHVHMHESEFDETDDTDMGDDESATFDDGDDDSYYKDDTPAEPEPSGPAKKDIEAAPEDPFATQHATADDGLDSAIGMAPRLLRQKSTGAMFLRSGGKMVAVPSNLQGLATSDPVRAWSKLNHG